MQEKATKTSTKQRVIIMIIAILMLLSTVAVYVLIVLSNGGKSTNSLEKLNEKYNSKLEELMTANISFSEKYLEEMKQYSGRVKAYNEVAATNATLATEDIKAGTGRQIGENDDDYMAYYIGWCADGSIFDSSFSVSEDGDIKSATSLKPPLIGSTSMIRGWMEGIVGMKIGGVRQITMNGDLAYDDTMEVCGGLNKPLKFIVMMLDKDANLAKLTDELQQIDIEYSMAAAAQME